MELELTVQNKETGAIAAHRLPLSGRVVLGRGPESPVPLDAPLISREHIAFSFADGRLLVEDLSANGSWINGQAMGRGKRFEVTEADAVQVPGYEIRCAVLGLEAPPAVPPAMSVPPVPASKFRFAISGMEVLVLCMVVAAGALVWVFQQG